MKKQILIRFKKLLILGGAAIVLIQFISFRIYGASPGNSLSKDREPISEQWIEKYGITFKEMEELDKQVFFIDAREPEEFAYEHVKGAKHIRAQDIDSIEKIKNKFQHLTDKEFEDSFFIVYCHTGTRGAEIPAKLNVDNVKFLIKGGKFLRMGEKQDWIYRNPRKLIFDTDIVNEDFSISIDKAVKLLRKGDNLFIDGRLRKINFFPFAYDFRIGQLSTQEYNQGVPYILNFRDKKIVYITDIYADVYYAKLLIQRLRKKYGFKIKNYYVLFRKSNLFYQKLKDLALIE